MEKSFNLKEIGIDSSEDLTVQLSTSDLKKLVKNVRTVNNKIGQIITVKLDEEKELKQINEDMKLKCAKQLERKAELSLHKKQIGEQVLFLLGKRTAYQDQLKDAGIDINQSANDDFVKDILSTKKLNT